MLTLSQEEKMIYQQILEKIRELSSANDGPPNPKRYYFRDLVRAINKYPTTPRIARQLFQEARDGKISGLTLVGSRSGEGYYI